MAQQCTSRYVNRYRVVVRHPRSLSTRCGDCRTAIGTLFAMCWPLSKYVFKIFFYAILILSFFGVFWLGVWMTELMSYCHQTPYLELKDVRITDMVVYQNNSMATTDTPWLVNTYMNASLSASNGNTVAGCYSTFRRMYVHVEYRGQQIVQQQVPLDFGLKPRSSRPVEIQVQGEHFPVKREIGSLLEAELRNASGVVNLQVSYDTRYLRNDRKADWLSMGCNVTASTPENASQVASSALVSCYRT